MVYLGTLALTAFLALITMDGLPEAPAESIFVETASAMEIDAMTEEASSEPMPLIIKKIVKAEKTRRRPSAVARPNGLAHSMALPDFQDDTPHLGEGRYTFEGETFEVSSNGRPCHYVDENTPEGTLVSEHVFKVRIQAKNPSSCR